MPYNGWTNYQTWNVPLWFDNDEVLYRYKITELKHCQVRITAEKAKEICLAVFPGGTPDVPLRDMGKVNWQEIAEHFEEERQEMLKRD